MELKTSHTIEATGTAQIIESLAPPRSPGISSFFTKISVASCATNYIVCPVITRWLRRVLSRRESTGTVVLCSAVSK